MGGGCDRCEHSSESPNQLGIGRYIGRVARSVALPGFHLSTVIHDHARSLPEHAHDWPYVSTLLRGAYVSRTRARELEFKPGMAVYHPEAFQHRDEIGREGGIFFNLQIDPKLLQDAERGRESVTNDPAVLEDRESHFLLARLYAAACGGADVLILETLAAELIGIRFGMTEARFDAQPSWLKRTEERLFDDRRVSLDDLSNDAGVHRTTLCRAFRRRHGCSIGAFHAQIRTRTAFTAITATDATLAEISDSAGYADQSHMTRALVQAFRISPARLRRATLSS